MNESTKEKNNMNEITKQIIAKFCYAAALADALERGETIQCHKFGEWQDLNCLTIDVEEISIRKMFYGWRDNLREQLRRETVRANAYMDEVSRLMALLVEAIPHILELKEMRQNI